MGDTYSAAGTAAEKPAKTLGGKYLTFKLGGEEYGLEIMKVQEIIKMMDITKVPRTPEFVKGVINLRGKVIPVVDMRVKFGDSTVTTTEKTCIIVVQVSRDSGPVTMGTIVDEVCEVLDIDAEHIDPVPDIGFAVNTEFILGMGKVNRRVIILMNADRVLSSNELMTVVGSVETE